jgi:hypothetical protein
MISGRDKLHNLGAKDLPGQRFFCLIRADLRRPLRIDAVEKEERQNSWASEHRRPTTSDTVGQSCRFAQIPFVSRLGLNNCDAREGTPARLWIEGRAKFLLALIVFLLGMVSTFAQSTPPEVRAEKIYTAARAASEASPNNVDAAWKFGRACFDWAEFSTDKRQRAKIAGEGMAACQKAVSLQPNLAAAHYYLALNVGELAQTKSLGALRLVGQMEEEFKTTLSLDEKFDFAGADRGLGLLYRDAPGWPASVGSRSKAKQHLQRAVTLAADYPENRLNLGESLLRWGEKTPAQHELKALEELLPAARKKFTGEAWESSWSDWDARLKKFHAALGESQQHNESPRNKK